MSGVPARAASGGGQGDDGSQWQCNPEEVTCFSTGDDAEEVCIEQWCEPAACIPHWEPMWDDPSEMESVSGGPDEEWEEEV